MRTPAHRIRSIAVIGGFLDGARFELDDGLNCFIGARGTGKTTALEFVRYALDCLPGRDDQPAERRRIEALVERNLAGGRVEVVIETRDGVRFTVSRAAGEEPLVLTADGRPTDVALRVASVFRADIFSQNEVESIADRGASQLVLLDNFEAERMAAIAARLESLRCELTTNADQIVPLMSQIATLGEELATLPSVEERLRQFRSADGDDAVAINRAHALKSLRDRENRLAAGALELLGVLGRSLAGLEGGLARDATPLADPELERGPNGELAQAIGRLMSDCGQGVDELLRMARGRVADAVAEVTAARARLASAHRRQEIEFRGLIERHQQAQGEARERAQLEQRLNELHARGRQRRQAEERLANLNRTRQDLLQRLHDLWDERFAIRRSVVARINSQLAPAIRVGVTQFGNPERYQRLLEEGLRGARIKHLVVAQRLANALWPGHLADAVSRRDAALLMEKADLNPDQAEKVVAALGLPEMLFRLETVELLDLPKIELRDGNTYKDSLSLSTGQKCTAILPILLLDSENPLLVDQPEDNLDNRFIFEAVVGSIREVKRRRQLIFVTHNPNIPVLGDAERVFVLDSDGASARNAGQGTVDECKTAIVTLLEGGEDAFKARKCRYAY